MKYNLFFIFGFSCCVLFFGPQRSNAQEKSDKGFQAGSAMSVITPPLGYSINGGMQDRNVLNVHDETHARAIVLDDGETRLAFVVSDLCMVYRETLDKAKARAHEFTGIPTENMMMSATHTHSSGTACAVFQSDPEPEYLDFLSIRIADALIRANENRVPARIGWGFGSEPSQVHNRRWKLKPGKTSPNPFGGEDVVQMNPGVNNENKLEPAGPTDPEVSVVSVVAKTGEPIAVLANYSLHYVGRTGPGELSADYFGMFNQRMAELLNATGQKTPFVSIMSNGTSGDINNNDYSGKIEIAPGPYVQMNYVANLVASEAYKVIQNIEYQDNPKLSSAQKEISIGVRLPDEAEIKRAEEIVANAEGPNMKTRDEIYARETILISDYPDEVDMILQAFRIGDLAIAAIPCEVFVQIGLNLKENSAIKPMFTISLANGYFGYLPTPQHHSWGGYETWRARSSFLEVNASEKITEVLFGLLEDLK